MLAFACKLAQSFDFSKVACALIPCPMHIASKALLKGSMYPMPGR